MPAAAISVAAKASAVARKAAMRSAHKEASTSLDSVVTSMKESEGSMRASAARMAGITVADGTLERM